MSLSQYIQLIYPFVTVVSAVTCGLLAILSFGDSLSRTETRLKHVAAWYLITAAVSWYSIFSYAHFPKTFVYINSLCYLGFLLVQVLFYHFLHILTQTEGGKRFPWQHYILPFAISGTLFCWSLDIPFEVQLEIVKGRGAYIPAGYEAYAKFFLSKPPARLLFGIFYVTLTVIRLRRYYRKINLSSEAVRKPKRWVLFLVALALSSILCSLIGSFISRSSVLKSPLMITAALIITGQHIVIAYYIIRRQFLPYAVEPEHKKWEPDKDSGFKSGKWKKDNKRKALTKKNFETYISERKPYLDSNLKITDLVDELGVNRTYISNFINKTYGVNFSRHVNRLRLAEMERLARLPSNTGKKASQLAPRAGFTDAKHYMRAKKTEETTGGKQ